MAVHETRQHRVSHQTVRLTKGKHVSPEHGACVMELASMLAGEPFTDHPQSVSKTIACFLRGYNDMLDDDRRQDLYEYAAKSVGTAASDTLEELRAERLMAWIDDEGRCRPWTILRRFRRRSARKRQADTPEVAARYAIRAIHRVSDELHMNVLSLVDELIAIGSSPGAPVSVEESPLLAAGSPRM